MTTALLTRSLRRPIAPLVRSLATASTSATPTTTSLPFVKNAIVSSSAVSGLEPERLSRMLKGKGLMAHVNQTLPSTQAQSLLSTLFNRSHPDRLLPGSVLSVTSKHAPTNFSGVLIQVRYKGPDTSFTLRNVIQRTGVEMTFMVGSPALQDIKVIHRAGDGGGRQGRRIRRAKLFYLRDQPAKMTAISTSIRRTQS